MSPILRGFPLLVLACGGPRQRADSPPPAPTAEAVQGSPCDSAGTQTELTACAARNAARADSLEAEAYAHARQALTVKGVAELFPDLERSETAWRQYRDAGCKAASGLYQGGSLAGMIASDCRTRLAEQRAAELKVVYLDWASR